MMPNPVTVSVPATSANLGPGFDCLGLALDLRHDVTFSVLPDVSLHITAEGEDVARIPTGRDNLVYRAALLIFERLGVPPPGLYIHQKNCIPIGSGLGSSSSAVLAGMFGANALLNSPLSAAELLQLATDLEGHPDNVAPAVYGGLVLGLQGPDGLYVERITVPPLRVVFVLPDFQLLTDEARAALPALVPRADAIFNASRTPLLVRALEQGDYGRLALAMEDRLHQPYRLPLIPGMVEALRAARGAGAAGVALSGAGPGLLAFVTDQQTPVAEAAKSAFREAGLACLTWYLDVDTRGVYLAQQAA